MTAGACPGHNPTRSIAITSLTSFSMIAGMLLGKVVLIVLLILCTLIFIPSLFTCTELLYLDDLEVNLLHYSAHFRRYHLKYILSYLSIYFLFLDIFYPQVISQTLSLPQAPYCYLRMIFAKDGEHAVGGVTNADFLVLCLCRYTSCKRLVKHQYWNHSDHDDGSEDAQQLLYISLAFGLSLAVNAWVYFRISGGLFSKFVITLCVNNG
jgi:hypothetical protein